MTDQSLDELRSRLHEMDRRVVELLNERARLSIAVGEYKRSESIGIYDPAREERIIACIEEMNGGPLPNDALKAIYREIFSASRNLQKPFSVAYLGPEASFTHQAARRRFGTNTAMISQPTVFDVFEALQRGEASCGVVPVENSLEGSVKMTLDNLISTTLSIVGEIFLPVSHCLLSRAGRLDEIRTVYSHPQALAQCRRWLRENLPNCVLREEESTACAARHAFEEPSAAAVASREAADAYGLSVLASAVEDHRSNVTRFLVISNTKTEATGRDKTSVLFASRHEPGSLLGSLKPFADQGINLTRIVSHPMRERAWEYLFFVDFIGHADEKRVSSCLEELKRECTWVKVLGSYPAEETLP
ncbi:MAG: hypothetical protein AVO39_04855 [delta proteobacterium MLS_D]|jgi:chorismate mutase / prephenate dehydratase|nr:MAG: hypothetical protein AVO39_04855 [delta proteobacterium MLS_D]